MSFTKDTLGTTESVGGVSLFESLRSNQNASGSYSGLMSAGDKAKLDGIEEGANKYIHPNSGVVPGKYMQVEVNEQGHVVAGRTLAEGTLKDYGIVDAYIDLSDNSIVLGSHRLKPITPSDKVRWDQIINNPDTLAAYGIKDAEISDTGIIRLGEMTIKPLTAESTLSTAKLEGIIDKANLPDTLQELGLIDVAIDNGTINIGGDLITPLTADSQLAADKITGVIDLKNIPVGAMERCVVVEDDPARFALTANDVQKGDTVKVINPTPTMYMVVDENKLDSADGYVVYSAGNANSVPWSGITDKPDHYYELPPADINTLGGVIVGDNISVDTDGKISTHPPYVLPQATNSKLGGVKIGKNLSMQSDGTLNVPNATSTTAGVVKAGNNINIGADGTISGIAYNLPVATSSKLGGVKIGKNVETLGDGTLSVPVATKTKAGVVKAGTNINIADDGTISTDTYQLPTATALRLGGIKVGRYLSVDSEGLLNATGVPAVASKTELGGVIIGNNINVNTDGVISVTLPTKLSELSNDTNYITSANLSAHNKDSNAHTDIRNRFNEFVKDVTGSNATLTITKGNGTTSTVTVNNVANATKATQDSVGQQINTTYLKGLSISGQTITYTKGNGTTGTITVPTGAGTKSYITESVVNSDGSWYRKYSDGWLEQGGLLDYTSNYAQVIITTVKPFANTNYYLSVMQGKSPSNSYTIDLVAKTNTNFTIHNLCALNTGAKPTWYACGMGAK